MKNQSIVFAVIALIAGAVGGYFFGLNQGKQMGRETVVPTTVIEQEKKVEEEKEAAGTLPAVINPAEVLPSTNPFESVKTNPFEGVEYVNPFK